jgi:hypothetical protein
MQFWDAGPVSGAVVALIALQALFLWGDEWLFHRARGLGRWERWGHPADAVAYALALAVPAYAPVQSPWVWAYVALAVLSALLITKDEWVHAVECPAGEHWVHAVLFLIHPAVLIFVGLLWLEDSAAALRRVLPLLVGAYACCQIARGRAASGASEDGRE